MSRRKPRASPRQSAASMKMRREEETVRDIDDAIEELQRAREELLVVQPDMSRQDKARALVEPLSRLSLVMRFAQAVLQRHRWSPAR